MKNKVVTIAMAATSVLANSFGTTGSLAVGIAIAGNLLPNYLIEISATPSQWADARPAIIAPIARILALNAGQPKCPRTKTTTRLN
jgi:hypothetical protein